MMTLQIGDKIFNQGKQKVILLQDQLSIFSVLGLHWSPENDDFTVHVNVLHCILTKWHVLSAIAKMTPAVFCNIYHNLKVLYAAFMNYWP